MHGRSEAAAGQGRACGVEPPVQQSRVQALGERAVGAAGPRPLAHACNRWLLTGRARASERVSWCGPTLLVLACLGACERAGYGHQRSNRPAPPSLAQTTSWLLAGWAPCTAGRGAGARHAQRSQACLLSEKVLSERAAAASSLLPPHLRPSWTWLAGWQAARSLGAGGAHCCIPCRPKLGRSSEALSRASAHGCWGRLRAPPGIKPVRSCAPVRPAPV